MLRSHNRQTCLPASRCHDSFAGPLEGKSISDLVDQINDGKAYVNVHTEKYPAGEIRGQIE